jgi:hypothetical protein
VSDNSDDRPVQAGVHISRLFNHLGGIEYKGHFDTGNTISCVLGGQRLAVPTYLRAAGRGLTDSVVNVRNVAAATVTMTRSKDVAIRASRTL